jgi:hypothetical protein
VLIVMSLGLGLPAAAGAQSAGDDQYADPFEETPAQSEPVAPTDGGASEPATTAAPAAGTTAPAATATGTGTLPRTGFDLVLLLVTGAVLLLSGFTVRRVLTGPYTAAR